MRRGEPAETGSPRQVTQARGQHAPSLGSWGMTPRYLGAGAVTPDSPPRWPGPWTCVGGVPRFAMHGAFLGTPP